MTTTDAPARRFERLPWWRNGWRLGVVWLAGLIVWALIAAISDQRASEDAAAIDRAQSFLAFDLLIGHLAIVLVAFRRRWPVTVMVVVTLLSSVSAIAAPAAGLAGMSLAASRRLRPVVAAAVINMVAAFVFEGFISPLYNLNGSDVTTFNQLTWTDLVVDLALNALIVAVILLVGWNIGSRRALIASWRAQADTARSEQAARVSQAQLAERSRIAREMHDVLAHRLSLVAMHAGVLEHRTDLSDDERRHSAGIVRSGVHQALEELRDVLGVLRSDAESSPEFAPQPDLTGIPSLVAEVTSSGHDVTLEADPDLWPQSVHLPERTGRHAYRVIQEALTNARKHAPGTTAAVTLTGGPGEGLDIVVANPTTARADGDVVSGGRGLTGMAERVSLAGGTFEAGHEVTRFVVRVHFPWPAKGEAKPTENPTAHPAATEHSTATAQKDTHD